MGLCAAWSLKHGCHHRERLAGHHRGNTGMSKPASCGNEAGVRGEPACLASCGAGVVALWLDGLALPVAANFAIACTTASGGGGADEAAADPSAALLLHCRACRGQRHKHTFGLPALEPSHAWGLSA